MKRKLPILLLAIIAIVSCNKEEQQPQSIQVITGDATNISYNNATLSGQAILPQTLPADTRCGILYSTNPGISISTATEVTAKSYDSEGRFSVSCENLTMSCPYYYRAFVYSDSKVVYGEEKSFSTLFDPTKYTDLSALGTANCYIVPAAGCYKFNATVKGGSAESVGTLAKAEVLWETFGTDVTPSKGDIIVNAITLKDGFAYFSTPSTLKNGNVVIAVKDASDNILWSWHIWVCQDFDPAVTAQVYNNKAGTMMDRDLGATSVTKNDVHTRGLLYQWGRKDPFLGSDAIYYPSSPRQAASTISWPNPVASNSNNGTIAYAVAHPTTFITYNNKNNDWYYTGKISTDNSRWRVFDKAKGTYDPCPAGWRVPDGGDNGVWSKAFGSSTFWWTPSNWDSVNIGMDFGKTDKTLGSGTIWYPATGYRNYDSGSLANVGYYGYCWSCSTTSTDAYDMRFDRYGYVYPANGRWRADGLPVRCCAEIQK